MIRRRRALRARHSPRLGRHCASSECVPRTAPPRGPNVHDFDSRPPPLSASLRPLVSLPRERGGIRWLSDSIQPPVRRCPTRRLPYLATLAAVSAPNVRRVLHSLSPFPPPSRRGVARATYVDRKLLEPAPLRSLLYDKYACYVWRGYTTARPNTRADGGTPEAARRCACSRQRRAQ